MDEVRTLLVAAHRRSPGKAAQRQLQSIQIELIQHDCEAVGDGLR